MRPPPGRDPSSRIAASMSFWPATCVGLSSSSSARAAFSASRMKIGANGAVFGLYISATRETCGATVLSSSSHFAADAGLEIRKSGDVAARPRHALHQARFDRLGDDDEHDRRRGDFASHRECPRRGAGHDHFGLEFGKLARRGPHAIRLETGPAVFDLQVAAFDPAERGKALAECDQLGLARRIARRQADQHADAADRAGSLRADCGRRPRRRGERGSEQTR